MAARICLLLLVIPLGAADLVAAEPVEAQGWSTCESYMPADGGRHAPFEISCWGDDGSHLYGTFTYDFTRDPRDTPPATLHGRPEGAWFRPNIKLQVRRNWLWPWMTIGDSNEGDSALLVDQMTGGAELRVYLDAFRLYLGKRRYGRVVLESGESAQIYIDDLLRPEHESHK